MNCAVYNQFCTLQINLQKHAWCFDMPKYCNYICYVTNMQSHMKNNFAKTRVKGKWASIYLLVAVFSVSLNILSPILVFWLIWFVNQRALYNTPLLATGLYRNFIFGTDMVRYDDMF